MHFDRPDFLWLLSLLPLLLLFLTRYALVGQSVRKALGRSAASRFLAPEKRDALTMLFSCAALASLALALARPYIRETVEKPEFQKMNLVFLLDVSPSMNAQDVWPSRLDRSKEVIERFVQSDTGILRFGLVSFSESSVILSYLTSDLQNLLFYLDFLRPDRNLILGTDVAAALMSGLQVLEKERGKAAGGPAGAQKSVMVLLSDGEDHGEELDKAIRNVSGLGVRVHTIAVGTTPGATMPVINERGEREHLKDEQGRPFVSRLNPETLQRIAQQTGARYYQAGSGTEIEFAFRSIVETERRIIGYSVGSLKRELFQYFVGLTFFSQLAVMALRL